MKTEQTYNRLISIFAAAGVGLALFLPVAWAQTKPTITLQPVSTTNLAASSVTLTVTVAGTGPFSYQWQSNGTTLPNNIITTVAGGGVGDGGSATNASLFNPSGVAVDVSGNLFIADQYNSRIRKVDVNGLVTTVAGNGWSGSWQNGIVATNAGGLSFPRGVAVDAFGNLFVADTGNNRIRKVDLSGSANTVVGNGKSGYSGG